MKSENNHFATDAADCATEPIHIPGAIQEHGLLIALRNSDFTILQISANVFDMLGVRPEELIHQPLSKLMPLEPVERASHRLGERMPRLLNPIPIKIEMHGRKHVFDGIMHRSGRILVLELEPHVDDDQVHGGFGGFYETVREVITKLMVAESLEGVLATTCEEIRTLTKFDRVLVYKFDEDWNGTVINESRDQIYESLMHHRFPASDIPAQARALYATNWLRIISNVDYKPQRVVPANNPLTDKPLDMSNSVLRSVSPVHLEYMRNMGQTASMSISLLKGKKLWGLISCHHSKPRYLSYTTRVAAEFIGQIVSAQIEARSEVDQFDRPLRVKRLVTTVAGATSTRKAAVLSLSNELYDLMQLASADGVSVVYGDICKSAGSVPEKAVIDRITKIAAAAESRLVATADVCSVVEDLPRADATHPGVMAVVIDGHVPIEIIWFRKESKETIPWSGNPFLTKERDPDGRIRPRKSFETYLEQVEGRSRNWTSEDVAGVQDLADFLSSLPDAPALSVFGVAAPDPEPRVSHRERRHDHADHSEKNASSLKKFSDIPTVPIAVVNANGVVRAWSKAIRSLTGFDLASNHNASLDTLFSDVDIGRGLIERAIKTASREATFVEELWIYRSDKTSFWGEMSVGAMGSSEGEALFIVTLTDRTLGRAAEENLVATKAAAEAANQAKSAFLANMSHEIRTPLGAVLGFAELLHASDQTTDERAQAYSAIKKNGAQLLSLINDLLDMNKIEANKLELEVIDFDLRETLRSIVDTFKFKASENSINFECRISTPTPKSISGDPTRFKQVLINLVGNAIKFTPRGGSVGIEVSFRQIENSEGVLDVRVRDNGAGMTEDQMSKLFQPFTQADASTTRLYGGTGLGLFVSQRIARSLNGTLSIESSKPSSGSCFLFSFKLASGAYSEGSMFQELGTETAPPSAGRIENNSLSGVKILLVDDSPDNRTLISIYLKKAGAQVSLANNGREGVDTALAQAFDIVLMDVQMPVMDGNAAVAELKNRGYKIPIVALTAHALKDEREFSLRHGFQSYLTKPIAREELIETIKRLVTQG